MKNPVQHLSFEQAVLRAGELLKRESRTILGIGTQMLQQEAAARAVLGNAIKRGLADGK